MSTLDKSPALSVQNISKSFGPFKAVDAIDLEVAPGEIFGFLGPNGAGKSTTIRLILDLLRSDSGTITLFGKSNRDVRTTHRDIGFLSGDMELDTDLTGRQYLGFVDSLHGANNTDTIASLSSILEADLDKKIGDYSRGNRQKIGLIAALLHKPKLLILDEPTSGFDPLVQEKFATIIREYVAEGGTVFMSSHVLTEVQHLCDRVAFIKEGRIITTRSVHELLDTNAKRITVVADPRVIKVMLKDYGHVVGLALIKSHSESLEFSYSGDIGPLLSYITGNKITDVTIREPELEEIFGQYYEPAGANRA
jgi:ABC-2 type transport system ATP-binding protein